MFAIACCAAQNLRKVPLADPFILLYDGVYYAYGTGAGSGIEVWTSRDLSTWERAKGNARDGLALHRTDVWGEKWFWAPEVYRLNDKFYMYFTAEEHICVATSDSPLGPFVQETRQPMIADEKCIDNTLFYAGDMKDILTNDFIAEHGRPDVIITDPPRAGMHQDVVDVILFAEPKRIVYVSCNPATQARDLQLLDAKYKVKAVQPVDMFPHTHHVENVVLLELKD